MTAPPMRLKLPAVRRYVQSTPWSIMPEKGAALLEVLSIHASGQRFTAEEIKARVGDPAKPIAGRQGAIQVIPIFGVVAHRMDLMSEMSGGVSTLSVSDQFDAAMADPNITAIVFNVDSPGGSVDGVPELAARIRGARGKGKKLVAVANTLMASAAYWIGSACDEVVSTPSGAVGSIGVFMVHLDESGFDEQMGLTYSLIFAGKHKVDGNPYEPLSNEARAALQAQVDEYYALFVGDVAKGRAVKAADIRNGYGEGRCLTAKQALDAGLVDRIDTFDAVLSALGAKNITASGRPRNLPGVASAEARGNTARADVPMPDDGDDDGTPDPDECPECGAPMNDGGGCTACPYQADDDTDDASAAAGRAATDTTESPVLSPAPAAEESIMPTEAATAPANGATAAEILAAERKRVSEIAALCAQHKIDAGLTNGMLERGITVGQASSEILAVVGERRAAAPRISSVHDRAEDQAFTGLGEQIIAMVRASQPNGRRDVRLDAINQRVLAGTPSGMDESVGSEGGFFIQPDLLPGIIDPVYNEDPILSRVTRIPIGSASNSVEYNVVDETARTTGNRWGGIQMYWAAEADAATKSKPAMRRNKLELKKLMGLAYLTDELGQDAPAANALLQRAFQAELAFMLAAGIFKGTGAGQMQGILNSGALVTQAIEATQAITNTAQFISMNVTKMLARVPSSLWDQVIWLYNQELLPYLVNATVGSSTTVPVFMSIGGLANRPNDTILGRAAYPSEMCEAVGTPGDILCLVPSQYHLADKGGPVQAVSVHVRFLNDETVLRITYRTDGVPIWRTAVTPFKGANSRSPFVALNTRS